MPKFHTTQSVNDANLNGRRDKRIFNYSFRFKCDLKQKRKGRNERRRRRRRKKLGRDFSLGSTLSLGKKVGGH